MGIASSCHASEYSEELTSIWNNVYGLFTDENVIDVIFSDSSDTAQASRTRKLSFRARRPIPLLYYPSASSHRRTFKKFGNHNPCLRDKSADTLSVRSSSTEDGLSSQIPDGSSDDRSTHEISSACPHDTVTCHTKSTTHEESEGSEVEIPDLKAEFDGHPIEDLNLLVDCEGGADEDPGLLIKMVMKMKMTVHT